MKSVHFRTAPTKVEFTECYDGLLLTIAEAQRFLGRHLLKPAEEEALLELLVKRRRSKFTTEHSHAVGELVEKADQLEEAVLKTQYWQTNHHRGEVFIGTSCGPAATVYRQAWDAVTQALGTKVEE